MYVHFVFGLSDTLVAAHVDLDIPGVLTVRAVRSACVLLCTNRQLLVTWLKAYVYAAAGYVVEGIRLCRVCKLFIEGHCH